MKQVESGGVWPNRRRDERVRAEAYFLLSQGLYRAGQYPLGFRLSVAPWDAGACDAYRTYWRV